MQRRKAARRVASHRIASQRSGAQGIGGGSNQKPRNDVAVGLATRKSRCTGSCGLKAALDHYGYPVLLSRPMTVVE